MIDYLHYSIKVPSQPLVRLCQVRQLAAIRRQSDLRISWTALFLKSYAVMAEHHPDLRTLYMTWPWGHLYQHSHQVGQFAITKEYNGENWLDFCHIECPEKLSLSELQEIIDLAQTLPVGELPRFKLREFISSLPAIIRRPVWWMGLCLSGKVRANLSGTFGLTSVSAFGAVSIHPPSLGSIVITYGPVNEEGEVCVTFVYDHRVLDGATIAKYLAEFENIINGVVYDELKALQSDNTSE